MYKKIMMKRYLLLFGFGIFVMITNAQITDAEAKVKKVETVEIDSLAGWRSGGNVGLNIAQSSFVNWAAGGENSVALNAYANIFANYKDGKNAWDNSLDVGYGLLQQESYDGLMKTDDRIELNSKYGRKAFKDFYYAVLLNFKTQFSPGFMYPNDSVRVSNLFAPAYLLTAVGLNYKPTPYFSAFLAPFTGKMTFVLDTMLSNQGSFGVEKGKKIKSEFGGYVRLVYSRDDFQQSILKNVAFTTKLDLFSNYLHNPQNIDVNWETIIGLKVNKYITVNLNTVLMYDDDIKIQQADGRKAPKIQFKEVLGIGFAYKF